MVEQKHKGARNELFAATWLFDNGYEVFRNLSPYGIIDIVAIKDGKIYLFDVKSTNAKGKAATPKDRNLKENGVLLLGVLEDKCVIQEPEESNSKSEYISPIKKEAYAIVSIKDRIKCKMCDSEFFTKKSDRIFCSHSCRDKFKFREQFNK